MSCLELAAQIAYCLRLDYRGVAQLVEYRSPKPGVAGSIPVAPASRLARQIQPQNLFGQTLPGEHALAPGVEIGVVFPGTELHDAAKAERDMQRDVSNRETLTRDIGR